MPDQSHSPDPADLPTLPPEQQGAPQHGEQPAAPVPPRAPGTVVGIGGSAGALDGYERFLLNLPGGSGAALIVVPHLDPQHRGLMPELLQRCTDLPVVEIVDGTQLQADHVYVIPPGRSLSLMHGMLLLSEDPAPGGMLIDSFFESLALDQADRAVGVVLSGAGTDGTRGVRAIKENFGRVLVQEPSSAEYPSMPQSAAATRLADAVLPPEDLAQHLYRFVTASDPVSDLGPGEGRADPALQKILHLIRARTGRDFTGYKTSTLVRRIDRRMKSLRLDRVQPYVRYLQETPGEVEELLRDLTINVTSFFRDPEAFNELKEHLRSLIMLNKAEVDTFRVWVAGCSTGEEAYSVAIVLQELCEEFRDTHTLKVQVFATDIDKEAIETARYAMYPQRIEYNVSPERLSKYFLAREGGYQVRSDIRDMVVFALHSTFGDPPFTRLDLLTCRNMLIYLNSELQKQVLGLFHYALREGGLLFLGVSETVGQDRDRDHFIPVNARWRIYRRGEGAPGPLPVIGNSLGGVSTPSTDARPVRTGRRPDVAHLAQNLLLSDYTPPAVLVNQAGDILFVNGRTSRYLELQSGRTSPNNVLEMARDGLRYELPSALREAVSEGREVTVGGLRVAAEGSTFTLDVVVRPLPLREDQQLLLILFNERPGDAESTPGPVAVSDRAPRLERELQHAKESLQATIEEMAVSLEELRSTNEELQTSNEELQSSNEELVTSKEELQSLNEELTTINAEHEHVIQDLAQANDDMRNLLDSAGIATLFLDNELRIKRFTSRITGVINLIEADVARPITDIRLNLRYEQFAQDIGRVLTTLAPYETQVQDFGGQWYLMRISPYRTSDNFIDGVVVTFTDVGVIKRLEAQLEVSRAYARAALDSTADPLVIFDQDRRVVTANRALCALVEAGPEQAEGERLHDVGNFALDLPELQQELRDVIATEQPLVNYVLDLPLPRRGIRKMKLELQPVLSGDGQTALFLLRLEDVTELLRRAAQEGEDLTGSASDGSEP